MKNKTKKDTRSTEIKKILKKAYPNSTFRVSIDKYSLGESIQIKTDAIQNEFNVVQEIYEIRQKREKKGLLVGSEDYKRYKLFKDIQERRTETEQNIKKLIGDFWHVDYCECSGEVLSGGNTFCFVEALEVK